MEIKPADKELLGLTEQIYKDTKKQPRTVEHQESVTLNTTFEKYVALALADKPSQPADIEEIRRQLNAGQLDSPESIRQAAETILKQGI